MDGSYSTLIRSDKQIYWELKMVLHVPQLISGAYYMLWHQIYDEPLSNKKVTTMITGKTTHAVFS